MSYDRAAQLLSAIAEPPCELTIVEIHPEANGGSLANRRGPVSTDGSQINARYRAREILRHRFGALFVRKKCQLDHLLKVADRLMLVGRGIHTDRPGQAGVIRDCLQGGVVSPSSPEAIVERICGSSTVDSAPRGAIAERAIRNEALTAATERTFAIRCVAHREGR